VLVGNGLQRLLLLLLLPVLLVLLVLLLLLLEGVHPRVECRGRELQRRRRGIDDRGALDGLWGLMVVLLLGWSAGRADGGRARRECRGGGRGGCGRGGLR